MIDRLHRFRGHGSVQRVYGRSKGAHGQYFSMRFAERSGKAQTYRAAVVVSRKVHKSAVVRNRIRRRIYEIIRLQGVTGPWDVVIVVHTDAVATLPHPLLISDFTELCRKAHIALNPPPGMALPSDEK